VLGENIVTRFLPYMRAYNTAHAYFARCTLFRQSIGMRANGGSSMASVCYGPAACRAYFLYALSTLHIRAHCL